MKIGECFNGMDIFDVLEVHTMHEKIYVHKNTYGIRSISKSKLKLYSRRWKFRKGRLYTSTKENI